MGTRKTKFDVPAMQAWQAAEKATDAAVAAQFGTSRTYWQKLKRKHKAPRAVRAVKAKRPAMAFLDIPAVPSPAQSARRIALLLCLPGDLPALLRSLE